jgi:hypothetical protein
MEDFCISESEHMYYPLWIHVLLALILLYFPLDDFIMFLALLCRICTSKTKHLYFPLHDLSFFLAFHVKSALLKLNILYFLILLHILPACIVLYFPILLHILSTPIVLYFILHFIIFLAFHIKVALPKTEYLYFSSTPCVLCRVTGRTSLIFANDFIIFATIGGDSALPKFEPMYFMSALCVLPDLTVMYLNIGKASARKNIKKWKNYGECTSQNLTCVLPKLRPCTFCCHCVYFQHFYEWFHYFPCNLRRHALPNLNVVLPDTNSCTSNSHIFYVL